MENTSNHSNTGSANATGTNGSNQETFNVDRERKREDSAEAGTGDSQSHTEDRPNQQPGELTREDLPDSTNESTGATGSGQRQDSN